MTAITTAVELDQSSPRDFVYELDVTSRVIGDLRIRNGRDSDSSDAQPGTCSFKLNNNAGLYTPAAGANAVRPLQGVQVTVESQELFTGFVRRVFLDPKIPGTLSVDCFDWLGVLARADVSTPLYRDVRSDILAHRIVDYAEVGELCANPRWRDDETGYSDLNGASNDVVTDVVLEGANGYKTATSGAASGWKYTIPSGVSAGDTVTVRVYIYGDPDETWPSGAMSIRVCDDVDTSGTISASQTTTNGRWRMVEVTNTFDGGASAFYVQAYRGTLGADGTFRTGAVHITLERNACPRDFDEGQAVFAYVAPRRDKALTALREVAVNEGGYIYVSGAGTLMFEDRSHRWRETASLSSQGTVDEVMVALPYEEDVDDRVGEVELTYQKWEVGAAGTIIWGLYPVPQRIPANGSLTIDIDFGGGSLVRDVITPVANTDFTITAVDGSDATGSVSLEFDDYGGGARAVFTDSGGSDLTLDTFQVRGTPVRPGTDNAQATYTPSGAPDLASKLSYAYRLMSSGAQAQAWAEWLGDRYVTQRSRLPVTLVNKSSALVTQMTERAISDRVTLTNDDTDYSAKVNEDFHIDAVEYRINQGDTSMEALWHCTSVWNKGSDEQYYWKLGTGELGDAATATTTTALAP